MDGQIPPPPDGYVLQGAQASSIPPPPPGYQIQQADTSPSLPDVTVHPSAQQEQDANGGLAGFLRKGYEFNDSVGSGQNFLDAAVHNLAKLPVGIGQLAAHGLQSMTDSGASTAAPGSVGARLASYVDQKVGALDNAIASNEQAYQKAVPTNVMSSAGAVAGNVLPFVAGGEVAAAPKAATTLGKIVSGAITGGAIGATQPITTGAQTGNVSNPGTGTQAPSFAQQKADQMGVGALTGGLIPTAGMAARGVGNLASHVFSPQSIAAQNIARLVGTDATTLAKLDQSSSNGVPGVMPTTAQVAPSPSAVAAEKALGNTPGYKEQLVQRQADNNAARLAVLQSHAGDDASLQAAKDARASAVAPFIEQHLQPATPATRWTNAGTPLDDVISNPGRLSSGDFDALKQARAIVAKVKGGSMQEDDAVQAMKELEEGVTSKKAQDAFSNAFGAVDQNMIDPSQVLRAAALTRNTGLGARPAVRDALDKIMATINQSKNTRGLVPADVLDSVRQNINDFLVSPTGKRATAQEALGVAPIRDQLVQTIGQHAPGYADYLATYAKHSAPINTMQAASDILARVDKRSLNSTGAAPLSLNDINQGLSSIDKGRYGISPAARNDLDAIQGSLKQEGISNSLRSPGSDTAYNINAQGALARNLLGPTLGGPTTKTRGVAALIGATLGEHFGGPGGAVAGGGIGAFINKGADVINKRIMDSYAKGILNPAEAASLIRVYLKGNSSQASKLLANYPQWNALISAGTTQQLQKANP